MASTSSFPNLSIPSGNPPSTSVAGTPVPIQGASPLMASSIESFARAHHELASSANSMPSVSGVSGGNAGFPKTANFLNQLETMMSAVKKEAGALESMKQKLKDMEELKAKYFEAKNKIQEAEREATDMKRKLRDFEQQNQDLRHDMQKLNDIYNNDRAKFIELQQSNARLEQELTGVALEKDFFLKESQRIPELKKALKSSKATVQQLKSAHEEEKSALQTQIAELEKKNDKQEKSKSEISQHVWQLTEQIDNLKFELEEKKNAMKLTEGKNEDSKKASVVVKERYMMVVEDYKIQMENRRVKFRALQDELVQAKNEKESLVWTLARKEDEQSISSKKLVLLQESYDETTKTLNKSVASLQDTVKDLSTKNTILSQELSNIKQSLGMKGEDVEKLQSELSRYRQAIPTLENQIAQKDMEYQHSLKAVTTQKDEYFYKLQSVSAQLETVTAQGKAEQSKYWEELKKLKETEAQLVEEAEKISAELQEKLVYIHNLEMEKNNREKSMKHEVSDASHMINTLKDELEKRLAELVTVRQEKDQVLTLKEQFEKTAEELKNEVKRNEEMFKRTLESERNKYKQELLTRQNRVKSLEQEKSELLNETQELMNQTTDAQRQLSRAKQQVEDAQAAQGRITEQLDFITAKNQELTSELKKMLQIEQDLREQIKRNEEMAHEELRKFDSLFKESKKTASQQALELNQQMKSLFDEIEGHKRQIYEYNDKEKKWELDRDRMRAETETAQQRLVEAQDNFNKEAYNLKREIQDLRQKQKMAAELKTKIEMEVINLRMECSSAESEIVKMKDVHKHVDSQCQQAQEQAKSLQVQVDQLTGNKTQLQNRISELENVVQSKNTALEHLHVDFQQLERENLLEIRRLKLCLSNTEQEINELRPLNHHLTKELNDCKTQFSRNQSQHNSSVTNMLEEVKKLEENLSKERRVRSQEQEEHRRQVKDMELLLEKSRYELDDYHNKMKNERQEKEIKITQYEDEISRIRSTIGEKDSRIEELENAQHNHRKAVLSLQEKMDQLDSENTELKNRMEIEASHRKRLEHRLRSMLTTAEINDINGQPGSMPPRSRGGMPPSSHGDSLYGGVGNNDDVMFHNSSSNSFAGGSTASTMMMTSSENVPNGRMLSARSGMSSSSYNTLPMHGGVAANMHNNRGGAPPVRANTQLYGGDADAMSHSSSGSLQHYSSNRTNSNDYTFGNMDVESNSVVTSNSVYSANPNTGLNRVDSFRQMPSAADYNSNAMLSARGGNPSYGTNPSPMNDDLAFGSASMGMSPARNVPSQASFNSPPRSQYGQMPSVNSAVVASSPAVDRVSAALALKVAQQNRMMNSNSSNASNVSMTGGATNILRHSSANRLLDDDLAQEYSSNTASGGGNGGGGNSVEESIRRTQMVINRRLGLDLQAQPPSIHETPKSNNANAAAAAGGLAKTPNSGRSTSSSKLHETIQQAHSLYPTANSPSFHRTQHEAGEDTDDGFVDDGLDEEDADVGEYNLDESVSRLLMPSGGVRPISPPPLYSNATAVSNGGGGATTKAAGGKKKKKKKATQQLPKI